MNYVQIMNFFAHCDGRPTTRWIRCGSGVDPVLIISADGQWTLMVSKWFPRSTMQIVNSGGTVAVCKFGWSLWHPVTVEFVNGSRFRWYLTDWRRSHWAFSSEDNENLMFFKGVNWNLFRLRYRLT